MVTHTESSCLFKGWLANWSHLRTTVLTCNDDAGKKLRIARHCLAAQPINQVELCSISIMPEIGSLH